MQKFIPTKTFGTRYHLPWLSPQLKRLIRETQRTYNRTKTYQNPADWLEYKVLQSETCNLLRMNTTDTYQGLLITIEVQQTRSLFGNT